MQDSQLLLLIKSIGDRSLSIMEKRRAQNRLLRYIQTSSQVRKDSHPEYLDALDKTYQWMLDELTKSNQAFQPQSNMTVEKSLFIWFNYTLKYRIRDLYRTSDVKKADPRQALSLDYIIANESEQTTTLGDLMSDVNLMTPTLSGLDAYIEHLKQSNERRVVDELEKYIRNDPEDTLKNLHIKASKACNCKILSQKLLLQDPPVKFSDVSKELGANYQTLKSHWEMKCKPCLQKISHSLGYSPDF